MSDQTEIKYLLETEKRELFDAIKKSNKRHRIRDYALYSLSLYCALRPSEIGLIKTTDLRFTSSGITVYCRRVKGSNNNTILIIDPEVDQSLRNYLDLKQKMYGESMYLFPSQKKGGRGISRKTLDKSMKCYCQNTSIPHDKQHMHVLKHTRAVDLGNTGVGISDIQWWLGHKNIENTMIYAQFSIRQQLNLYHQLTVAERTIV